MKMLLISFAMLGLVNAYAQDFNNENCEEETQEQVLIETKPSFEEASAINSLLSNKEVLNLNAKEPKISRVQLKPYLTGGMGVSLGAPLAPSRSSLDVELSFGGGLMLESEKVGLFVEGTGKMVGKWVMLAGPVGVEAKAGILLKTKNYQGVYLGGVYYRQMGYNRLAQASLNANIYAVEVGTMSLNNPDHLNWFARGGIVEGSNSPYIGGGVRMYVFKKDSNK